MSNKAEFLNSLVPSILKCLSDCRFMRPTLLGSVTPKMSHVEIATYYFVI